MSKTALSKPTSIRLSNELLERLEIAAEADMRSLNSEISKRLHLSFETSCAALRDQFAGLALASGQASNWRDNGFKPRDGLSIIENTAVAAYVFADAMLKAREGGAA